MVSSASEKPWRVKSRAPSRPTPDVEIYESKFTALVAIVKPLKMVEYHSVESGDGSRFCVPLEILRSFPALQYIWCTDGEFKEHKDKNTRFCSICNEVLELALRFSCIEHTNSLKTEAYTDLRTAFQFEIPPSLAMELIDAAHYLGHAPLVRLCASMIAHYIEDVPDLHHLPTEIANCIAERLTAAQLLNVEEREGFQSLKLDTDQFWKAHCLRVYGDEVPAPDFFEKSRESEWHSIPPALSWKSLFITKEVQSLADRQTEESSEDLFSFLEVRGKFVHDHKIYSSLWTDVFRNAGMSGLLRYMALFPNLRSLCLHKLHGPLLEDQRFVAYTLSQLPNLLHLDAAECGLKGVGAHHLAKALAHHPKLQVLLLGDNAIGAEGLTDIMMSLPKIRSLRSLDVTCTCNDRFVSHNVVEALTQSCLEELILGGGHESCLSGAAVEQSTLHRERPFDLLVFICSQLPPTLKTLNLTGCDLLDWHITQLVQGLEGHHNIRTIDLSNNNITSAGADVLFNWLVQNNTSLEVLKLDRNPITESCSTTLIAALQDHPVLRSLSLQSCYGFGDQHFLEVIAAAEVHAKLLVSTYFHLNLQGTPAATFGMRRRLRRGPISERLVIVV